MKVAIETRTRILLTIFIFAVGSSRSMSQTRTLDDLKIALMLKLCQYVVIPGKTDTINMFVYSRNNALLRKTDGMKVSYPGSERPVRVTRNARLELASQAQIIFVDQEESGLVSKLLPLISKKHILLFTENYKVARDIMFNLLPNKVKGTITFEFNRTNLVLEGFEVDNKIIELRGSEIDVRELYRQTKSRLEEEEQRIAVMQMEIDSQRNTMSSHNALIEQQNTRIKELHAEVGNQLRSISSKEKRLGHLSQVSKKQQDEIAFNKQLIAKQQDMMRQSEHKFSSYTSKLDSLDILVATKEVDIRQKQDILAKKEELIGYKDRLINLQVALIALSLIFVIVVANAYWRNKTIQKELASQKRELQATLEKLTNTQEHLVKAEKMASLGVLTAGIAHEINNPINFINSGLSGLKKIIASVLKLQDAYRKKLQDSGFPEDVELLDREYDVAFLKEAALMMIGNIGVGVDRSVKIVKSLKAFARSDEEMLTAIDLHESIDMALTILTNQYKYNIEIIKRYGDLAPFSCYSGKMNQVFMNLIANAIQAIPEKGHIWISTRQDNHDVFISIRDDGVGIPDELKSKIFDPFFTTKEVGTGTGMGLSIAFSIVGEHHGNIDFSSTLGKGTEFTITLPRETNKKNT